MSGRKVSPQPDPSIAWPTQERQRKGGFDEARTYEFEPDEDGRLARKPVRTIRAADATAAGRLAKFGLTPGQVMAAVMFERDWEASRLEQKMTANLLGSGGSQRVEVPDVVFDARDRLHHGRNALRLAGEDVVRVVEDVVLMAASLTAAGAVRSAQASAGRLWAAALLSAGLSLLEAHYRANGRMAG